MTNDKTTIEISKENYIWLESKKIHPRQAFNEVIDALRLKEVDKNGTLRE